MNLNYKAIIATLTVGMAFLSHSSSFADATEMKKLRRASVKEDGVSKGWIAVLNDEEDLTDTSKYQKNLQGEFVQTKEQLEDFASAYGGTVTHVYKEALYGMAVIMEEEDAERMAQDPRVKYIEQDTIERLDQQSPATWGIDRIDQVDLPLSNSYDPGTADGTGVTAYIIDTGILITHEEFKDASGQSRAIWGTNTRDSTDTDCHGHGTHVAGTVGGSVYGVAKNVNVVAVKVLDCNGSGFSSMTIAGVEWALTDAISKGITNTAVANMSLGGSKNQASNDAVKKLHNGGVLTAVAAGNDNADACNYSPASEPVVITVGSTTSTDTRSSFSNFGTCVDIFAPGSSITAAWIGSNTATRTISGTSMASPHVAGALALFVSSGNFQDPENALISAATQGKVGNPGNGSPNKFLYVSGINTGPAPSNSPSISPAPTNSLMPTTPPTTTQMPSAELIPISIYSNVYPDYCLASDPTDVLYLLLCSLPSAAMFYITPQGYIRSADNGKCLEANPATSNGAQPTFEVCNESINQRWRIQQEPSGASTVRPEMHYPNICLDENGVDRNVYQWACDGSSDQYFNIGPTKAPPTTSSPTSSPSNPPATCVDSTLKFKFMEPDESDLISKFKYCSWVGSNTTQRCVKANRLSCPKTCNKCHVCKDSPLKFKIEKANKTMIKDCKWVKEKSSKRCNSTPVANACRETCNVC